MESKRNSAEVSVEPDFRLSRAQKTECRRPKEGSCWPKGFSLGTVRRSMRPMICRDEGTSASRVSSFVDRGNSSKRTESSRCENSRHLEHAASLSLCFLISSWINTSRSLAIPAPLPVASTQLQIYGRKEGPRQIFRTCKLFCFGSPTG